LRLDGHIVAVSVCGTRLSLCLLAGNYVYSGARRAYLNTHVFYRCH